MFTKAFINAVIERAIKTFAQSLIAVGLTGATGILDVDWTGALSAAGLATVISVLTSVASGAATDGSPSLADEKLV